MSNSSTWDNISDGISKAAKAVGNAAGDVYTYSKKTVKTASLKCELREKYCALGRIVAEEAGGVAAANEKKSQLLSEIDGLKSKLSAEDKKDAEPAVAVLVCSKCGQSLPSNAAFCFACGTKL